ncbi:tRNA(Ile)-lysidine synthetase [Oleiphilus messinensis]|uniref:tRNA(Ile)-lysidine synthase n=1 Tax=Oleiphilus messinensis TaxID=141451 RepID=A0A1Y0IDV7_9GAMM|nr:tRNA lysidine(34) synthetase TilS [Oleiphilus messinensis]ARU57675.1 tRNA(Ile)-lysidine synthetase [Oleiphilus messinensis]
MIKADALPDSIRDLMVDVPDGSGYWVALSGGLDSMVLLWAAGIFFRKELDRPLYAIHINHGLSPNADHWEQFCREQCALRDIPFQAVKVDVDSAGVGLEAGARNARYNVFSSLLQSDQILLQGHHGNDQVETFLMRAIKGAGAGLAGIPRQRKLDQGMIFRPFLTVSRRELSCCAQEAGLSWIHDESNDDIEIERNYLRHQVWPTITKRWPAAQSGVLRTMALCEDYEALARDLAKGDIDSVQKTLSGWSSVFGLSAIDGALLGKLPEYRQRNVIRVWLQSLGGGFPGQARFERIWQELIPAQSAGSPQICWPEGEIRRFQGDLYFMSSAVSGGIQHCQQPEPAITFDCKGEAQSSLLRFLCVPDARRSGQDGWHCVAVVPAPRAGVRVSMVRRNEGLSSVPSGKSLKKYFQARAVPVWLRGHIPVLCYNEEGVAIPGCWSRKESEFFDQQNRMFIYVQLKTNNEPVKP